MKIASRWVAAAGVALAGLALAVTPAWGQTELIGPLRIRDLSPFNILRLDMLPAHAGLSGPRSWTFEAELSYTNFFVMSENVKTYLRQQGDGRRSLTRADAEAILNLGEDAYYVDGELGLLELTFHYRLSRNGAAYLTLPVYDFAGGFLDAPIEGFHDAFGVENRERKLVTRNRFQAITALGGEQMVFLDTPINAGYGDPVVGARYNWQLGDSPWRLVLDGAVKTALRGERLFLSTGSNDYGLQGSLQGKFKNHGLYFSASFVRAGGRVLGVPLESRVIPTLTAAYEVKVTRHTNAILQLYASESAVRDTSIEEITENKYQASLGLRSRRGRLVYGFAVTENVANFQNTSDVGLSLTLAWISARN